MRTERFPLLIVEDDADLASLLALEAEGRGYATVVAASVAEADAALDARPLAVALVDLALGPGSGFDVIRRIKAVAPDAEVVVISGTASLASAIESYELAAFAFVQKPFDTEHLFATVARAIERRQMNLDNERLVWELQTINEIADGIARSLELEDILTGALQRVVRAFDAVGGSIRLKDRQSGAYTKRATVGPASLQRIWTEFGITRPSDRVIETQTAELVEDFEALVGAERAGQLPVRSALSVPMFAGTELVGTITVGSRVPGRFAAADQKLLAILAGQIAVAVTNARLHDFVRRGKREWERTFDAIGDAIAVFDARAELLRGNRALAELLDRPITELRGTSCGDLSFCGGRCPGCAVTRALAGEGSHAELTTACGEIFAVTTFPVSGGADGAAVVQVAKNVTEEIRSARRLRQMSEELSQANERSMAALVQLKSTQAQLLQAEKLSAIGQLVAGVAHELNNPLTSVIGYAQLLEEELCDRGEIRDPAALAQDLRRIAQESERAARIVRNLLAFARRQSAARAPHDVAELISRVLALRAYELRLNGVELETDFQPGLPCVVADGGQIQQALLNLLLNSEQAMRGRAHRRLRVGARFLEAADAVELSVSDTGHGIDRAILSRIFDPFFTTRDVGEGTGLGLSICYGIIRDHGGQISVDTRVDAGTTFTIVLPARVEDEVRGEILVAHPDQGERDFISAALQAWGYQVAASEGAADALARYERGGLLAALVDYRVLAGDLPRWRAARGHGGQHVPLVLLSIGADDTDGERFGREQAGAMLGPPYDLRALRGAVRAVAKELV
jgi:two-component system NtrC family sensor kinase